MSCFGVFPLNVSVINSLHPLQRIRLPLSALNKSIGFPILHFGQKIITFDMTPTHILILSSYPYKTLPRELFITSTLPLIIFGAKVLASAELRPRINAGSRIVSLAGNMESASFPSF